MQSDPSVDDRHAAAVATTKRPRAPGRWVAVLVLAAVAIGVIFVWQLRAREQHQEEMAAVAALRQLNGVLVMDGRARHAATLNMQLIADGEVIAEAMPHVARLKHLQVLDLSGTAVGDVELAHVARLTNLTSLHLNGTSVTDAGLKHLKRLRGLQGLHLAETEITTQGLADIAQLSRLLQLDLSHTDVANGLDQLTPLENLQWLLLRGVPLAEQQLTPLAGLPGLRRVTVGADAAASTAVASFADQHRHLSFD